LITEVPITGSQCSDRHEVRPWALFGGEPGGNGGTLISKAGQPGGQTVRELYGKVSSSKYANVTFDPGDRITLITPGGGGYGDPKDRDPARLAEDLREGYVSVSAAGTLYRTSPADE
jgi:N-methylhydantoinase B